MYDNVHVLTIGVKSVGIDIVKYINDWFVARDKVNGDVNVNFMVDWPSNIICWLFNAEAVKDVDTKLIVFWPDYT